MRKVHVIRFDTIRKTKTEAEEWVVTEQEYHLILDGHEVTLLHASPGMEKQLAVGYLAGRGITFDCEAVRVQGNTITVGANQSPVELVQSPPQKMHSLTAGSPRIPASLLVHAASRLQKDSLTWRKTRATHSVALFQKDGTLIQLVEDVSRRSALDKSIGQAVLDSRDLSLAFAVLSCRITEDMVIKAANVGIPIVASRSTVIEPAVTAAHNLGVTLLGYTQEDHAVAFAHPERII
ncbi:MAG: formate dehydrogenase accessory sulfurtransferase FdhD [Theionarchaea archaeon]|nr:formate dehydrogenase accessory sulfurtransferase FdhD [Theionarchaea archaeon]MBU7001991.1 formate dehydrogenase accessory sulfurtransferase FdhD [Theionarchaea archaeon]MBU7019758.1 formate dehydrogenase accessory sulfurtransferase FdhD [Theionarchaea archaeon]MBU7034622.1 formate dehydrogenase accessory sulfurtransferase FdhD [Theionarchaea archaeon]MBU7040621.1 formate dehydrogenase accessory sulfurtransferase FdhD [Theionarchaea archaeon]